MSVIATAVKHLIAAGAPKAGLLATVSALEERGNELRWRARPPETGYFTASMIEKMILAGCCGDQVERVLKAAAPEAGGGIAILIADLLAVGIPVSAISIAVERVAYFGERQETFARCRIVEKPSRQSSTSRCINRQRRGMADSQWRRLRELVFERDQYKCQYCDTTRIDLTVDHIVPLSRGGTNDASNLATACRPCNSSKGAKLISEWEKVPC